MDLRLQVGPLRELEQQLLRARGLALPREVEEDAVVLVEEGVAALLVEEEVLEAALLEVLLLVLLFVFLTSFFLQLKKRLG